MIDPIPTGRARSFDAILADVIREDNERIAAMCRPVRYADETLDSYGADGFPADRDWPDDWAFRGAAYHGSPL